jgi:hypothetical protein
MSTQESGECSGPLFNYLRKIGVFRKKGKHGGQEVVAVCPQGIVGHVDQHAVEIPVNYTSQTG